jgi:uncharacterized repeat protein (TIGR02543 family)
MKPKAGETRQGGSAAGILLFNERKSKIMAKTLKKALALFLAVVMVISTVGMTSIFAAAEDGTGSVKTGIAEAATAQIVSMGESQVNYDGITVNKTLEQLKDESGNLTTDFKVTLSVTATEEIKQTQIDNPLAVCLVIDTSGSMDDYGKLAAAKQAAKNFVDALAPNCYISVVELASYGYIGGWENNGDITWTQNKQTIKNIIDGFYAEGASNMDDGLIKANELFSASPVSEMDDNNKYTVLITDGQPTFAMESWEEKVALSYTKASRKDYDVYISDVCDSYRVANEISAEEFNNIKNNHTYSPESDWHSHCIHCNRYNGEWFSDDEHSTVYFKIKDYTMVTKYGDSFGDGYVCTHDICVATLKDAAKLPGSIYAAYIGDTSDACYYYKGNNKFRDSDSPKNGYSKYSVYDLLTAITGDAAKVIGVSQISTLSTNLNNIASKIDTEYQGNSGSGWTVTDMPNAPFVTVKSCDDEDAFKNGGIVWKLADTEPVKNTSGNTTTKTYTYSLSYVISVNTNAPSFVDGTAYATSLTAATLTAPKSAEDTLVLRTQAANDDITVATFNNPTIEGTAAKYWYTVNVWKEVDAGTAKEIGGVTKNYQKAGTITDKARVNSKLQTSDLLDRVNANLDNYTAAETYEGEYTVIAGDNTLDFYYNRIPVNVTINRYYKEYGTEADGSETKANEVNYTGPITETGSGYVGVKYTAADALTYSGSNNTYTCDSSASDHELTLSATEADNIINLYYSYEYDKRASAGLTVNYYYRDNSYELADVDITLGDGVRLIKQYQEVKGAYPENPSKANVQQLGFGSDGTLDGTVRATETKPVTIAPDGGYTFVEIKSDNGNVFQDENGNYKIKLGADSNTVSVYFEKSPAPSAETSVSVKHEYNVNEHKVENGAVDETGVWADPVYDEIDINSTVVRQGEIIEVTKYTTYGGETYTYRGFSNSTRSAAAEGNTKTFTLGAENNNFVLEYEREAWPEKVNQTVTYIYRQYHLETQYDYEKDDNGEFVLDDDGNKIPCGYVENVKVYDEDEITYTAINNEYYKNVDYSVAILKTQGEDSDYVLDEVKNEGKNLDIDENGVLHLNAGETAQETVVYYERDKDAPADVRDAASYKVYGDFYSNTTHVKNGRIVTEELSDKNELLDSGDKHAFDLAEYDAPTYTAADGKGDYTRVGGAISETLKKGDNNIFTSKYTRDVTALTEATVKVYNEYYDVAMVPNSDKTALVPSVPQQPAITVEGSAELVGGANGEGYAEFYAGQSVNVASGAGTVTVGDAEYEYAENAAYAGTENTATKLLSEGENTITNKYYREVYPEQVTVPVTHTYVREFINEDGEEDSDDDNSSLGLRNYRGLNETAIIANKDGYEPVKVIITKGEASETITSDNDAFAAIIDEGYDVTLAEDGVTAIEFVYEKQEKVSTSYVVMVQNTTYKFDDYGNLYSETNGLEEKESSSSFVGKLFTVSAQPDNGFELVEATLNGRDILPDLTESKAFNLKAENVETNVVELKYEKTEYRPTSVTIYHVYKRHDTFKGGYVNDLDEKNLYVIKQVIDGYSVEGVNVGASFTFTEDMQKLGRDNEELYSYSFVGVVPDTIPTIEKLRALPVSNSSATPYEEEEVNVVTATYSVDYSTQATGITVKHEYYTVGAITGNEKLVGYDVDTRDNCTYLNNIGQGETFTVQPKTAYNGNEYTCVTTILDEYTADANNTAQEIVLKYTRVVDETISASSSVTHKYYLVKGNSKTYEGEQVSVENGNVKQTITVSAKADYNGNTYKLVTPAEQLNVLLGQGNNDVSLEYNRYEYAVSFNTLCDTQLEPQSVKEGEKAAAPAAALTRDGFNFVEWQLDGETYDFDTPVTADITLTAKWNEKPVEEPVIVTYVVSFDSKGGSAIDNQTVNAGEKAVKPADPTRDGYTFGGWFNGDDEYDFDSAVASDINLTAKWTENTPAPVNPTPVYPNYPAVVPTVPGETELPDAEVPLSELPDMEVPLGDLPEEELPEDEVPLAAAPSVEEEELEDDLVPLGDAPATGDSGYIVLYAILMLVSALGLVAIAVTSRRKKEDNC